MAVSGISQLSYLQGPLSAVARHRVARAPSASSQRLDLKVYGPATPRTPLLSSVPTLHKRSSFFGATSSDRLLGTRTRCIETHPTNGAGAYRTRVQGAQASAGKTAAKAGGIKMFKAPEWTVENNHELEKTGGVLIIGSGPAGASFAKVCVEEGRPVIILDVGASLSKTPGWHIKNSILYQRDVNPFASVIRGHLHQLSVPTNTDDVPTLDPAVFYPKAGYIRNNQNPDQDPRNNLPGAAACYAVGGMATHWTCACPRPHREREMRDKEPLFPSEEEYDAAEKLLNVNTDAFGDEFSLRTRIVREALCEEYQDDDFYKEPKARPQNLPLAVARPHGNKKVVKWTGVDTILGPLAGPDAQTKAPFEIKEQHLVTHLQLSKDGARILYAEAKDYLNRKIVRFHADTFALCGGTILTPQILYASGIDNNRLDAIGRYLTEQPMTFCQVSLLERLVPRLESAGLAELGGVRPKPLTPADPVPIKMDDADPQCWIPVSKDRPWHCQIHRDAFAYGDLAPNVDSRLIVDFRWFGIVEQNRESRVTFSQRKDGEAHEYRVGDLFGMPQPTFHFEMKQGDRNLQHAMMGDMMRAASAVGGILPGSEPQFMQNGLTLHIHGTTRMGFCEEDNDSVVDRNGKVWGVENLYLGGNGLIPSAIACNPTLTTVALATRAAKHLVGKLEADAKLTRQ